MMILAAMSFAFFLFMSTKTERSVLFADRAKGEFRMGKIAGYLMEGLIKNQLVKETDREIYQYGLEKLVGKIISYTALFLLAVILRMILPSLFFLGFFFALRGRTGGYHASTETGCLIGTMVIYLAVMELFLPFFMRHGEAVIACVAFSVFSVIAFAPVNHPNLGFDREELAQYKKDPALC